VRSFGARCLVVLLVIAVGLGVAVHLYVNDPALGETNLPGCTLRRATGLDCAGCGMTRATHELLHLRFGRAVAYNPLVVLSSPFLLIWCGLEVAAWLFQERYRGPRIKVSKKGGLWIVAVVLLYSVLRNIPVWPLTLLAPGGGLS
jgi:hypothetical protein